MAVDDVGDFFPVAPTKVSGGVIVCWVFFQVTDQWWWVASRWWLLAVDDISDLFLVAPAKADGGCGGPVLCLVGWVEDQ